LDGSNGVDDGVSYGQRVGYRFLIVARHRFVSYKGLKTGVFSLGRAYQRDHGGPDCLGQRRPRIDDGPEVRVEA
jgi:hypothetical protein